MSVVHVTKEKYEEVVEQAKTPVLLDFWADWCGPCKMISPIIDEIAEDYSNITVGKVNIDEETELAQEFGIMSIPTLVVLKNGKVTRKVTGVKSKGDIINMIQN